MSAINQANNEYREIKEPFVLALCNQKGGCGKTTTTLNLGGALTELGYDVLLVDLDPQGHLSEDCGFGSLYDTEDGSLRDALVDLTNQDIVNDLVRNHDEFDLIPAHADMFSIENELNTEVRREERLRLALSELDTDYDFILIDCPPNLGVLTNNALIAARNVLIPARPTGKSVKAIELLMHQKNALESAYGINIDIASVVGNEVSYDNESKEMMDWFVQAFDDVAPVFEIRSRVALQRAADASKSIFAYPESSDMEPEYLRLGETILEKADMTKEVADV